MEGLKRLCPKHRGTGMTPTDTTCHNHKSDLQQLFHNAHCKFLKCPHALPGKQKHVDAETLEPRNKLEKVLLKVGKKYL